MRLPRKPWQEGTLYPGDPCATVFKGSHPIIKTRELFGANLK